jgi:hypothetical protein
LGSIVQAACSGVGLLLLGAVPSALGACVVATQGISWEIALLFSFGLPFLAAGVLRMWHTVRTVRGLPDLETRRKRA